MTTLTEAHDGNDRDTEKLVLDRLHVTDERPYKLAKVIRGNEYVVAEAKTLNLNGKHVAHLPEGTEIGAENDTDVTLVADNDWHPNSPHQHVWVYLTNGRDPNPSRETVDKALDEVYD